MKKNPLILQCPGMVCSPPVVSKCLGEAHRRLELFTLFTLHYITLNPFFSFFHTTLFTCPTVQMITGALTLMQYNIIYKTYYTSQREIWRDISRAEISGEH